MTFYQPHLLAAGVSAYWLGLSLALGSLLGAASSHFAYMLERYLGVRWALFAATVLPGFLYLVLAASAVDWMAIASFVMTFGFSALQRLIFSDYVNRHIESENRTTVLSIISMLTGFYIAGMGRLTGVLAEISLPLTFVTIGVITKSDLRLPKWVDRSRRGKAHQQWRAVSARRLDWRSCTGKRRGGGTYRCGHRILQRAPIYARATEWAGTGL